MDVEQFRILILSTYLRLDPEGVELRDRYSTADLYETYEVIPIGKVA